MGDPVRDGISWPCSDAVDTQPRQGPVTRQKITIFPPTSCTWGRASRAGSRSDRIGRADGLLLARKPPDGLARLVCHGLLPGCKVMTGVSPAPANRRRSLEELLPWLHLEHLPEPRRRLSLPKSSRLSHDRLCRTMKGQPPSGAGKRIPVTYLIWRNAVCSPFDRSNSIRRGSGGVVVGGVS